MRTLIRLAVVGLLGVATALLVSCGSSGTGLIPSANAGPLKNDFEEVARAAESGNGSCSATESALGKTEEDFLALPVTVDKGLHRRLQEGIEHLRKQALEICVQPAAASTSATGGQTSSTPTTSGTTSTETTTTSTPSTTTTPPSTQTTPTTSTPQNSGGGVEAPEEGSGEHGVGEHGVGEPGAGANAGAGAGAGTGAGAGAGKENAGNGASGSGGASAGDGQ